MLGWRRVGTEAQGASDDHSRARRDRCPGRCPGRRGEGEGVLATGVTAADVTSSSAILWAHADKQGTTYLQLTSKGGFGACDADHSVAKVKASKDNDLTVQTKVKKLDADTDYQYRWCTPKGGKSDKGKFTTAPKPKANETIRFALTGDQDARPARAGRRRTSATSRSGTAIRKQKNDFNVLMGDTIYSDTAVPGYTLNDIAITVAGEVGRLQGRTWR